MWAILFDAIVIYVEAYETNLKKTINVITDIASHDG